MKKILFLFLCFIAVSSINVFGLAHVPESISGFLDTDGDQLSNGYVAFYSTSALSTFKNVYSDYNGNNVVSQSGYGIQLNSSGQPTSGGSAIVLFGDGIYWIVIRDEDGVIVNTFESINYSEPTGQDNIPWINVGESYGYDDSDIQSALSDYTDSNTKVTFLMNGNFTFSSSQEIPAHVKLLVVNGSTITVESSNTLTISSTDLTIENNSYFTGSGSIVFNGSQIYANSEVKIFEDTLNISGDVANEYMYIKWFDVTGDGSTDDFDEIQNAFDMKEDVMFTPGTYNYSSALNVYSDMDILGLNHECILNYTGATSNTTVAGTIKLRTAETIASPTSNFDENVHFKNLKFTSDNKQRNTILLVNARKSGVDNCQFVNCGGMTTTVELEANGTYTANTIKADNAGFSSSLDDLCEDIYFTNNLVDGQTYFVFGTYFRWVLRGLIHGNNVRFGAIAFWGGSAISTWDGNKSVDCRVQHLRISNNYCHRGNGGIYGNKGQFITVQGNTVEYVVDTGIDMEGCEDFVVDGNSSKYCGNYNYSTFYAAKGVFSNNLGVQSADAKDQNDAVGESLYDPNLGTIVFRAQSSFVDSPTDNIKLIGNHFRWEGSTGFGAFILANNYMRYYVKDNYFENIRVSSGSEIAGFAQLQDIIFNNNDFYFDNAPSDNDIYISLGGLGQASGSQYEGGELLSFSDNYIKVLNDVTSNVIVLFDQDQFFKPIWTKVENNWIDCSTANISIGYGDFGTGSVTANRMVYRFTDNTIKQGSIQNLSTNTNRVDPEVCVTYDADNVNDQMETVTANVTPDTTTYGNLNWVEWYVP